ncbi:MAG: phosphoribosylglycinamide formyltransferase [Candidatus Obscuribacterales bacterium]|nr:phosphoribosylglycinamide formyltransferase [Steroidobacteraceae bacterium]
MRARIPVVILISGRGSNMRALADNAMQGALPIDIRAVISDRTSAGGLQLAAELGIATLALVPSDFPDREAFDAALAQRVEAYAPKLVILAGYMRILSAAFVRQFLGRLVNIHPSLLPKYPGLHTHRRALEARDAVHGASVHFVVEELDAGPTIIQGRVSVQSDDTEATLSACVQRAEHIIYPQAVEWLAQGRVTMQNGKVLMDSKPVISPHVVEIRR